MPKSKSKPKPSLASISKTLYDIDLFALDPENARGHDARNIQAIADSIKQFGQRIPILVDADLTIRKGNGTWLAMKKLGESQVWAVPLELEGAAATAFAIADNRSAELAHWEWQIVKQTLQSLESAGVDIDRLGFADFELEPLLNASWTPPTIKEHQESDSNTSDTATERIILATDAEYRIITDAIQCRQSKNKKNKLSDGQALSSICREWMEDERAQNEM